MNIEELYELIESRDAKKIAEYMKTHDLKLEEGNIVSQDSSYVKEQVAFWDQRQMAKKINLNALTIQRLHIVMYVE